MFKTESQKLIPLLDLTSLNNNDEDASIIRLCQRALTPYGPVAAICIYPQFITTVRQHLPKDTIKIATVSNFPTGKDALETTLAAIKQSIASGVQEIDVVMPYLHYLSGEKTYAIDYIKACKNACGSRALLKVILETGAFLDNDLIESASRDMIAAGADFLKTSTGKIAIGARLDAAEIMLKVIHDAERPVGFKTAGGIHSVEAAMEFVCLAEKIMGKSWVNSETFRIGASRLLDALVG